MIICHGCKASFKPSQRAPHRYGVAAAECWAGFNALLAHERNTWGYPEVHRLICDAYSVQHPQNSKIQSSLGIDQKWVDASIQSIGIHLIALYFALEMKKPLKSISSLMARILDKKSTIFPLDPPDHLGSLTICDAPQTEDLKIYEAFAWKWAQEAWEAWTNHHDQIEQWAELAWN